MKAADCIRVAIPGASDDLIEYIIWNRTPYPFKKICHRELYKAAHGYRRASERGSRLCDYCHNIAVEGWICKKCDDALHAPNSETLLHDECGGAAK